MKLIESIQRGEKNYVCFSTKKQLNIVIDIIRGLKILQSFNILTYSSDMDDSQIMIYLGHVSFLHTRYKKHVFLTEM